MSGIPPTSTPTAPPPNTTATNATVLPPERPDRSKPVGPPKAMWFRDSKFAAWCDRCGQPIDRREPRVKESTSKAQRSEGNYGRTWHEACYRADGQPLGPPGIYGLDFRGA